MKKYNLSAIMKRAWGLVKGLGYTMSEGLKKAWKKAKGKIKFDKTVKVAVIEHGETNPYIGTKYDCESNYFTFNLWEKHGYHRIYINDYKRRALGYIDLDCNNLVVNYRETYDVYETAEWFKENYAF